MFTKILLIKEDIKNIFNILNKIIMHIFLLFIDIEFVILSIEVKTFILQQYNLQIYKNILRLIMATRLNVTLGSP